MEGFDKNLLNYIAGQVCKYKGYAQLFQSLKEINYDKPIYKCDYCELPHNKNNSCCVCQMSWCGRDYFCEYPKDGIGVITCINSHFCVKCSSCYVKNCNGTKSNNGCTNCCTNVSCIKCDRTCCSNHCNGKLCLICLKDFV